VKLLTNFETLTKKIKEISGFKDFNKMQKKAINENLINKNIIVSSPTSSGKTLIAEAYALNTVINKHKRVLYMCPLKALANEHYQSFKKKYEKEFQIKIALSTGDLDSSSKHLSNFHIIFITYEKLDSLIRHKADWLNTVGMIVVDEIHMIDTNRGATLETTIVELKFLIENLHILGLSATIPNALELAQWLDAELIYSKERPVKLNKGIFLENTIYFEDNTEKEIDRYKENLEDIVLDTIKQNKQCIVFTNSRRNAEALAKRLATISYQYMDEKTIKKINDKLSKIDFDDLTNYDSDLKNIIEKGVAFHHAGIRMKLRTIIEELFRENAIKVIASTPTLAAGLNLPAYRVIMQSLYRHTGSGMSPIPVKEYLQMCGRAGRKGMDDEGEAISIAKSDFEKERIFENFVFAEPEEIESQLSYEPVLRMQILALIANDFIYDDISLQEFFKSTFYAKRFGDLEMINYKIYKILEELVGFGFVELNLNKIKVTNIGRRVSELYIDPISASRLITAIKNNKIETTEEMLFAITNTNELRPYFKANKKIYEYITEELQINYNDLGLKFEDLSYDYEIVDKYFTYRILKDWIDEKSEQQIIDNYNILPGGIHAKVNIAEWITYATSELSKILGKENIAKRASILQRRVKHGIREELALLIELPNIGRVRARKLSNQGVKTIADLKKKDPHILANILGPSVTKKLLVHLKIPFYEELKAKPKKETKDKPKTESRQRTL
jgi:helicase